MSERAPHYEHYEQDPHRPGERIETPHEKRAERINSAPEKSPESIDKLLKKIEREAHSSHEVLQQQEEIRHDQDHSKKTPANLHHGSRSHTKLTMKKVWQQEGPVERAFSKVVHNPTVDAVSNVAGATAARPSGLLFGGIFSVIGSLGVLIVSRYYGYEYNFLLGMLFFVGGFVFGLLVELVLRLFRKA